MDIVDNLGIGELPTAALIDEKIGDAINYLILLEAMLKEDAGLLFNSAVDEPPIPMVCALCFKYDLCDGRGLIVRGSSTCLDLLRQHPKA